MMREDEFIADNVLICEIDEEGDGKRADAALADRTEFSRSALVRLMESGSVTRDGTPITKKTVMRAGDTVQILLPEIVPAEAQPEDIPLDIIYEDDDVIVINKPKGMVVHPAPGHEHGTMVSALLYHCGSSLSGIGGVARPGIVHRIDRDTTGLIAAAKNDRAHLALAAQLADHSMRREYQALVIGGIEEEGTVNAPIGRSPRDRKKMAVLPRGMSGVREAVTHYFPVTDFGSFSHIRLVLETGRAHQIRVPMSHIGHPVMGDEVYGANRTPFEKRHSALLCGQCLHAGKLRFAHPATGEMMELEAPLPAEFAKLLDILKQERR